MRGMTATDTDPRPRPGGLRWACRNTKWEVLSETRQLLLATLLGVLASVGTAGAEVSPQTMNGVPLLPIPTYEEVGLPSFTMPTGTPSTGANVPAAGTEVGGAGGESSVATSWAQYEGQAVGSGQCVALVQAADSAVGLTRTWAQGSQVQGNVQIRPGTTIATFDAGGRYANATDGSSHAAIYLGQNEQGIQVLDQWLGRPATYRTIRWSSESGTASNTGSRFYVVTHVS